MNEQHTKTWPDLAIGLYERLTGRNAEITYEFVDTYVSFSRPPFPTRPTSPAVA
jgi:hypothetical protein